MNQEKREALTRRRLEEIDRDYPDYHEKMAALDNLRQCALEAGFDDQIDCQMIFEKQKEIISKTYK